MSENLHNIDDLFKGALDDHEEDPSSAVWENLDRKLDKRNVISISQKYRRLKWVAAASLIFACAAGMYTVYTRKTDKVIHEKRAAYNTGENKNGNAENEVSKNSNSGSIDETTETQKQHSPSKDIGGQTATTGVNNNSSQVVQQKRSTLPMQNKTILTEPGVKEPTAGNSFSGKSVNSLPTFKEPKGNVTSSMEKSSAFNSSENQVSPYSIHDSKSSNSSVKEDVLKYLANHANTFNLNVNEAAKLNMSNTSKQPFVKADASAMTVGKSVAKKQKVQTVTSRFSLSGFFSPDLISNRVVNDKKVFKEDDKKEITRTEKTGFSSTIGALINYKLTGNWSIQSGFTFSNTTKQIDQKKIYARPDNRGNVRYRFNCSAGYSYIDVKTAGTPSSGDSLFALTSTNTLQYVGIPLSLQYAINKNKWTLTANLGLSMNILTKGQIETVIATGSINERNITRDIQGLKPVYTSGIAGVGVSYKINKKIAMFINPEARFALNSINKEGPVKTYKNTFGLAGGLTLSL